MHRSFLVEMRKSLLVLVPLIAHTTSALKLPRSTIAVAGANGRVGSMVCRELLRNHPQVTVRAIVRSASDPYQGYGRLSYEVGAEDGKMELAAAWEIGQDGRLGTMSMEFDEEVQGDYGLDRLEIREADLRYSRDVDECLSDVDAVVWCATAFNEARQRIPDRLDDAARAIDQRGMALFELRLGKALFGDAPKEDGSDQARREATRGKTADEDGLECALKTLGAARRRRKTLSELTGGSGAGGALATPLVLLSAAAALGYDEDMWGGAPRENEFGFRKRNGEALVRESGLPHVIVRSAAIDGLLVEDGLDVMSIDDPDAAAAGALAEGGEEAAGAVGVADKEARKRRIHPRDVARQLVSCLAPSSAAPRTSSRVVEVWTTTDA